MNQSRRNSSISKTSRDTPLFEDIPEYNQIITELSRGNLKGDFSKSMRRSKLSYDLNEILSGENNDELSYFVLFMDSLNASSYVKFLLDLKNFESLVSNQLSSHNANDEEKLDTQCECVLKHNQILAENTISIFSKYITKGAQYMIKLPSEIINQTIHNICPVNGKKIEPDCFKIARDYTFNILQSEFYDKYLNSEYHCKYILNILENRILDLSDILYDDIAVVYFLEYLEQENISDLLKFWIQAENFSRNILNFRECYKENNQAFTVEDLYNQWQGDAIVIYDNFISLQAKK